MDIYFVENKDYKVGVSTSGGELQSIFSKKNNIEYLWQGDSRIWEGRSPILFPIVGALPKDKFEVLGEEYSLPIHGFARTEIWELVEKEESELTFLLLSSESIKKKYPYNFEFYLVYQLEQNELLVKLKVVNLEKEHDMFFSLGFHPGFNVPLEKDLNFEDYYLKFNKSEYSIEQYIIKDNLLESDPIPFSEHLCQENKIMKLDYDIFEKYEALILKNVKSNEITIESKKGQRSVTVCFENFTYLGLWHAHYKRSPFLCIEPWCGVNSFKKYLSETPQKIEEKEGIVLLKPNDYFERSISIILT